MGINQNKKERGTNSHQMRTQINAREGAAIMRYSNAISQTTEKEYYT